MKHLPIYETAFHLPEGAERPEAVHAGEQSFPVVAVTTHGNLLVVAERAHGDAMAAQGWKRRFDLELQREEADEKAQPAREAAEQAAPEGTDGSASADAEAAP